MKQEDNVLLGIQQPVSKASDQETLNEQLPAQFDGSHLWS